MGVFRQVENEAGCCIFDHLEEFDDDRRGSDQESVMREMTAAT